MLGETGRDLEKTKRKTQQGDKPRLNSNGTQTGERKETKNDHLCVGLVQSKHSTVGVRERVRTSYMPPGTELDDNNSNTHTRHTTHRTA